MQHINIIALFISAVINMAVGALWYSPILFSKQWTQLIGKTSKELKNNMPKSAYFISFCLAIVISFVLSQIIHATNMNTLVAGAKVGFFVWLGFVATTLLPDYMFSGRPLKLYTINVSYHLVSFMLMGAVLGGWY